MGLPRPVLVKRINNELKGCSEYLGKRIPPVPEDVTFPIEVVIDVKNQLGYASKDRLIKTHRYRAVISDEYPFRKPEARWMTPIFHPNIMMPEDGGYVCVRTLDDWSFGSNMLSFIKGVENLVSEPNPKNPFGTDSCMEAARFFASNSADTDISVKFRRG
jgi:ubiquitin-protein ligase